MISFSLRFLLAFSGKPLEKGKKKKNEPLKKAVKVTVDEDSPLVFKFNNEMGCVHIDYELVPGKCKYQLDVRCWSDGAKIYCQDGLKMFKTIKAGGLVWVPVCIEHCIQELTVEDLKALQQHTIEFNLLNDRNKLGSSAKSDKSDVAHVRQCDVDKSGFVELFADNPDNLDASTEDEEEENENGSRLCCPNDFETILTEIIDYETGSQSESAYKYKDFVLPYKEPEKTTEAVTKKGKQAQKPAKTKAQSKMALCAQGEIFITDPNLAIFKSEFTKTEISKFVVFLSVNNLVTRPQKIILNPVVVKIGMLQNFPEGIFENTTYTDLYCKYSIPHIIACKTLVKPISRTVCFFDSHVYFTDNTPKIKLLEFLESQVLVVEVYATKRYPKSTNKPLLFGTKVQDANISKIMAFHGNTDDCVEENETLIGLSYFDLSSLLKNTWDYKQESQLHVPDNWPLADCKEGLSSNDFNIVTERQRQKSLLKEWMLLDNCTTLSVEAFLLAPQAPSLVLHQIEGTFKRLFCVIFEKEFALSIVGDIIANNRSLNGEDSSSDKDVLTGFIIDNGYDFAIFVEGFSVGHILDVWKQVGDMNLNTVRVFFNTDMVFETRIYDSLGPIYGLYLITLSMPFEYILKEHHIYVTGNLPSSCLNALLKLDLLFHSNSLKLMMQNKLFPTHQELVSFDVEYGVPFRWKPKH